MPENFKRQAVGIWVAVLLALGGCTVKAPLLTPEGSALTQPPVAGGEDQLKISIRPVNTAGFRSEDREQFNVDLSAFFTAFYVEIQNGLSRSVWLDASNIFLQYDQQEPFQALNEAESIEYYRRGDMQKPALVLIPKQRKLEKKEVSRIRELRLRSATLPPSSRHSGLIYFKKLPQEDCRSILLKMTKIQVDGEESPNEIQFRFKCSG